MAIKQREKYYFVQRNVKEFGSIVTLAARNNIAQLSKYIKTQKATEKEIFSLNFIGEHNIFERGHFKNHVCWFQHLFDKINYQQKALYSRYNLILFISVFQNVTSRCELSIYKDIGDGNANRRFQVSFLKQLIQRLCLLLLFKIYTLYF